MRKKLMMVLGLGSTLAMALAFAVETAPVISGKQDSKSGIAADMHCPKSADCPKTDCDRADCDRVDCDGKDCQGAACPKQSAHKMGKSGQADSKKSGAQMGGECSRSKVETEI